MRSRIGIVAMLLTIISTAQSYAVETSLACKEELFFSIGHRFHGSENYYNSLDFIKQCFEAEGIEGYWVESFTTKLGNWEKGETYLTFKGNTVPVEPYPYTPNFHLLNHEKFYVLDSASQLDQPSVELSEKLHGSIVLLANTHREQKYPQVEGEGKLTNETLALAALNTDPNNRLIGYHSRRSLRSVLRLRREAREEFERFQKLAKSLGIVALIQSSNINGDVIRVDESNFVALPDDSSFKRLPVLVVPHSHFALMKSDIEQGKMLTANLSSKSEKANLEIEPNYSLLVRIDPKQAKYKQEPAILVGAHLDSWSVGQGATDNGLSVISLMNLAITLNRNNADLRQPIILAFWGGHEVGFEGSKSFVERHIGQLFGKSKAEKQLNIALYLNLDNGAGKIRGIYTNGNKQAAEIFKAISNDIPKGFVVTEQSVDQTEHILFEHMGIPAFQFIQDPEKYIHLTHHTNYDVLSPELLQNSIYNQELLQTILIKLGDKAKDFSTLKHKYNYPPLTGNVNFTLRGYTEVNEVYVVGDFNNWDMFGIPLKRGEGGWEARIKLPQGRYLYKFIVDGRWIADPQTDLNNLYSDGKGHSGLTEIIVR
ncbi:M28 family peptidase [Pseudidiomarina aestuarii]|nr:M28 family peptidase [Pseudidiomarina aestuarii]